MARYVEYDDYAALYPQKLTADQFYSYLPSAEAYIDLITHNRAADAAGYKAERVKHAVCAVVGEMAAQDAAKSESGARLQSVTNDGYTEYYGSTSGGAAAAEADAIRRTARQWLSGTGLVSAV